MDMNDKPLRTKDLNGTMPARPAARRPPHVVFEQRLAAVRRGVSAAVFCPVPYPGARTICRRVGLTNTFVVTGADYCRLGTTRCVFALVYRIHARYISRERPHATLESSPSEGLAQLIPRDFPLIFEAAMHLQANPAMSELVREI